MELEDPEVRPRERPVKQWKDNIEEDLREMNLRETDATHRERERAAIKSPSPVAWGRRR